MIRVTLYQHPDLDAPETVRSSILVTTVEVEHSFGHDFVSIWNRGGMAGQICVKNGDGPDIARRLFADVTPTVTKMTRI